MTILHMKSPAGGAPANATLCWKRVEDFKTLVPFTDKRATCPECIKACARLNKATTNRGILKKGYGNR